MSKEYLEALECLEVLFSNVVSTTYTRESSRKDYNTIKQALQKAQEQEKVLKIVFEKRVDISLLSICETLDEYNNSYMHRKLTQEEFDFLKRYL